MKLGLGIDLSFFIDLSFRFSLATERCGQSLILFLLIFRLVFFIDRFGYFY